MVIKKQYYFIINNTNIAIWLTSSQELSPISYDTNDIKFDLQF